MLSFSSFLTLVNKFPAIDPIKRNETIAQLFPTVSKVINHQTLTPAEQDKEAKKIYEDVETSHVLVQNLSWVKGELSLAKDELWNQLIQALRPSLIKIFGAQFHEKQKTEYSDVISYGFSEWIANLSKLKLSLHTIDSSFQSYFNLDYPLEQPDSVGDLFIFVGRLPWVSFYSALNRLILDSEKSTANNVNSSSVDLSLLTDIGSAFLAQDNFARLDAIAQILEPTDSQLRNFPFTEGGEFKIDGPSAPGYFLVTEQQKKQLEQFHFFIPKFVAGPAPGQYYAQFETPSASNWKHFERYLDNKSLKADFNLAETQGKLADTSNSEYQKLTQALIKEIIPQITSKYSTAGSMCAQALMRIHPFANPDLNLKTARAFGYSKGALSPFLIPNLGLTATSEEYLEASNVTRLQLSNTQYMLRSETDKGNPSFDLDRAIGIWEVAADLPGTHRDPLAFIKRVKEEFLSPLVQSLVSQNKDEVVLRILHEVGNGL